jgi:hypothetical protein
MLKKIGVGVVAFTPLLALADVDVSAITSLIPDVTSVGLAVFGLLVVIKGIKLLRHVL